WRANRNVFVFDAMSVTCGLPLLAGELRAVVGADPWSSLTKLPLAALQGAGEGLGGLLCRAGQSDMIVDHHTVSDVQNRLHEEEPPFSRDVAVFDVRLPYLVDGDNFSVAADA